MIKISIVFFVLIGLLGCNNSSDGGPAMAPPIPPAPPTLPPKPHPEPPNPSPDPKDKCTIGLKSSKKLQELATSISSPSNQTFQDQVPGLFTDKMRNLKALQAALVRSEMNRIDPHWFPSMSGTTFAKLTNWLFDSNASREKEEIEKYFNCKLDD